MKQSDVCWRIEAVDIISTPGIIEINAIEYYVNETEDDLVNGIVGGLIEPITDPNEGEPIDIIGDTFIKVKKNYEYRFNGTKADTWFVEHKYPVKLVPDINDPRKVTIIWDSTYSG